MDRADPDIVRPPLLTPPLRKGAVAVAGVFALTFAVLALRYGGRDGDGGRTDAHAENLVDRLADGRRGLFRLVIIVGDPLPAAVLCLLLAAVALLLGRRRLAALAVLGPALTGIATTLAKPVVGRTIDGALAFPSGHTAVATALGLVVALVVAAGLETESATTAAIVAAGAVVAGAGMGVALVAAEVHYPTDTLGGFAVALVVVPLTAVALDVGRARMSPPSH